jgi:hypothetical protein
MGPAFYIMAILGCGEADTACEQVATVESRYESIDACNAATSAQVERHADLLYPVVVAQCQQAGAKLSGNVLPSQVDLPEPARQPAVRRAAYAKLASRG